MDFSELKERLGIENGVLTNDEVTIAGDTLTSNLDELIEYCYDNQPIVIRSAEYVSEDPVSKRVTIRGQSNFLNVPQLETEVRFSIDAQGQVQLLLKYTLIESEPRPNGWKFSKSFPNLPQVADHNEPTDFNRATQEVTQTMMVPLDGIIFYNSYFVVVSINEEAYDFFENKVDLNKGINFVSHLRPEGFLAIIETLFNHTAELTVSGTIRKPLPTETPQQLALQYPSSLESLRYPWDIKNDFPYGVPGILLQVELGIDYTIVDDKIQFSGDKLYLYTPLDNDWLLPNTNPNFVPTQAYTGSIELNGTGIKMDMVSPIQIGVDALALIGFFEGLSLNNLSQLVGLTGSDQDPLSQLPPEIQDAGDQLDELALINARVEVDYTDQKNINVSYTSFTVGMPDLKWEIWDDHFEIDQIGCSFDIYYPFSTINDPDIGRDVEVTIYGQLKIEGVPFNVYASNKDGFTVYAEMAKEQTLPLKKIMETYAPGVPPPSDLTINIFRVGIAPREAYSMALAMAQQPNPWVIPIGPSDLTVEDVAIGFMYPKRGPVQGSISGSIGFGDFAKISIGYDIPGDIIIKGVIPEITLLETIGELCNEELELPSGFDLTFLYSSVLIQEKDLNNWIFQFATTLEGFGSLVFEARKTSNQRWGFAFGLAMSTGQMSELQGLGDLVKVFEEWFPFKELVLAISSFKNSTFEFPSFQQFDNSELQNSSDIKLPATVQGIDRGFYFYGKTIFERRNKILEALINLFKIPEGTQLDVMMAYLIDQKRFQLGVSLVTFLTPTGTATCDYENTCLIGTLFADVGGSDGLQFGLSATIKTTIQDTNVDFNVTLATVPNGFFISGTMDTQKLIDFGPVQLADVAIELGISYQALPSFGFAASLGVDGLFHSSIAVMVDTTNPRQSMAAGSLSDLTLAMIVDKLAGDSAQVPEWLDEVLDQVGIHGPENGSFNIPANEASEMVTALNEYDTAVISEKFKTHGGLSSFPSTIDELTVFKDDSRQQWYLTSLSDTGQNSTIQHYQVSQSAETDPIDVSLTAQFYCVLDPLGTWIGRFYYDPGIKVSGVLELLMLKVEVDVEINQNKGIKIDVEMDPIVVLSEQFFSITRLNDLNHGPKLSLLTYQDGHTEPHFYLDGQITLLGQGFGIKINITKDGLDFRIEQHVLGVVTFTLYGTIKDPLNFHIGGSIDVDFSHSPIDILDDIINEVADASVEVGLKEGSPYANASFHVLGIGVDISFDLEDGFTNVEEIFRQGILETIVNCPLTLAGLML